MTSLRLRRRLRLSGLAVLAIIAVASGAAAWLRLAVVAMPWPRDSMPSLPQARIEALAARLRAHVTHLAGDIGVRHARRHGSLDAAVRYIDAGFAAHGLQVRREEFGADPVFENVEVEIRGRTRPHEIVVVGAHYDTVPDSPGADDNASGVAALLELAGLLADARPQRTLRLVAFANEESPWFMTPGMGALVHARRARERGETIAGMLSLEMLGYYSSVAGSQKYPRPLSWFYPDRGDFIGFVANRESRALVRRLVERYRQRPGVPAEGLAAPVSFVRDIARSDHGAFWAHGYPAVMVTDTANYRYPFYHTALDTPDSLDYRRMALVVTGLAHAIGAEIGAAGTPAASQ